MNDGPVTIQLDSRKFQYVDDNNNNNNNANEGKVNKKKNNKAQNCNQNAPQPSPEEKLEVQQTKEWNPSLTIWSSVHPQLFLVDILNSIDLRIIRNKENSWNLRP